jgi:hypothetical protein
LIPPNLSQNPKLDYDDFLSQSPKLGSDDLSKDNPKLDSPNSLFTPILFNISNK